jgi:hypothetical protein
MFSRTYIRVPKEVWTGMDGMDTGENADVFLSLPAEKRCVTGMDGMDSGSQEQIHQEA